MLLLAIFAISFSLRLAFLHEPFERDEGAYAYVAQEVLRGSIPYKDVIEIKPPAVYYLYAAGMSIFGETTEGVRIFTACFSLLTVLAVFLVARYLAGNGAGLVAALLYGLLSSAPFLQGSSSNTEVFMVLPLVLGTYYLLRAIDGRDRKHIFLCGVLYAVAMLVKTVAIPFIALAVIYTICLPKSDNAFRELMLDLSALAAGPAILASITLMYFFLNGALDDFLYWNVTVARKYSSSNIGGPSFITTSNRLLPEFLPVLVAAVPTFLLLLKERKRKDSLIAMTLPAALIGVVLPGKNFPHYFIQLVPPLAILAGIGMARLFGARRRMFHICAAILAVMLSISVYRQYKYYLVYTPYQVSMQKYGTTFVESLYVARYLYDRTLPSDYIFQWGFEMELYFLTGRRSPVPFISSILVGWSKDPAAAIHRMVQGINEKKPKYIVYQKDWGNFPGVMELSGIVMQDYVHESTVGYAQIYRRK
ncbi:glycosyltransferase family 39 protein [candidate division KSB1 bacterium]|nr:glycosyltransferase family 39 protein [candidate division KSB1 bacterium]